MGTCCSSGSSVVPDPPTQQEVFDDLDTAERKIWRIAFSQLDNNNEGKVARTHALMRSYFQEASSLMTDDDLDRVLQGDKPLTFEEFADLLKKNASDEGEALATFQSLSNSEFMVESTDARTALRHIGERKLGAVDWDTSLWDKVLNSIMENADLTVDSEWWVQREGRFERLVRALKQQKSPIL